MSNPLSGKHTNFSRGRKVRVICRDGSSLEGRFLERTRNKRLILDTGDVHLRNVAHVEVIGKEYGVRP